VLKSGRRPTAAENDERILDAAVQLVLERGGEAFGFRDVAALAGLSHGAVYSRYDNQAELLLDAWDRRLGPVVERSIEAVAAVRSRGDGIDALAELATSPEMAAALQLCVLSFRIDELADVVPRQLQHWLSTGGLHGSGHDDIVGLGLVALMAGSVLGACTDPRPLVELRSILRGVQQYEHRPQVGPPPGPTIPATIQFDTGDPLRDALLRACVNVVRRSGFDKVTLKRVGRSAGCAPTSVYRCYPTLEDMIDDLSDRAVHLSEAGVTGWPAGIPFDRLRDDPATVALLSTVGASLQGGCAQPEAAVRRRLWLETAVRSQHDDRLLRVIVAARTARDSSASAGPSSDSIARLMALGHSIALGTSLLADLVPDVSGIDWRPFAAAHLAAALT
jgi:AcrR family transcriptional regulator